MGNKQEQPSQPITNAFNYSRFTELANPQAQPQPRPSTQQQQQPQQQQQQQEHEKAVTKKNRLILDSYKCMDIGVNEVKEFQVQANNRNVIITKYFQQQANLHAFLSNLIKISKMMDLALYDQLKFYTQEVPYTAVLTIEIRGFEQLGPNFVKKSNVEKKLDLLDFVATLLSKIENIYLCPFYIAEDASNSFHLLNFSTDDSYTASQIFLAFVRWLFTQSTANFEMCLTLDDMPNNMPIYIQQIYISLHHHKNLTIAQLQPQIKRIKDKMSFLLNKTDSFYACQYYNKTHKYASKSQWIFMKQKHEIFFYHVKDQHPFTGKLIRKKKKVNIHQCHIAFDYEDLEILYVPENCKYVVKTSQFQFQSNCSISDIEIKYKLPLKLKNPLINRARNGDILLLEQYLYRYVHAGNKLIQETKRISDYIFLTSTRDSAAFIVKLSIDIFRNGIRVFYRNEELTLAHTGDQKTLEEISSIRLDIRHVIFCVEVYKGVFLMMASKNMWILDLNFECYFSYATPSQIKKLATFRNDKNQGKDQHEYGHRHAHNDQLFGILNQPFKVNFSLENDGNNVAVKDNFLHILGKIEGQPYYLKYSFVHRIGAIKLEGYHPLFVEAGFRTITPPIDEGNFQEYKFNFHQENSHLYKYRNWLFKGKLLVRVYNFHIKFQKTAYEVHLQIQKISQTLKQHLQKLAKTQQKLHKTQQLLLLYKIYKIYEYLFQNSITHSNISLNHLCFTESKELKIHGWSQPARNWHVSDYKDYLLVCFNVITYSTFQKASEKIIAKYEGQLAEYGILGDKIQLAFRQNKTIQKHSQIQKSLLLIKSFLQKQLCSVIHTIKSSKNILSFEYKTPRMTIYNTETQKLRKIAIIPQETAVEQFIFDENDKYVWNQNSHVLYIFTANHQFYELKLNGQANGVGSGHTGGTNSEEKLLLQDYEYLPNSINSSSFICDHNGELYSFGGIKKETNGRFTHCLKVYKFNWKVLTWQPICQLPQARINPHLVPSICHKYIYIMGGSLQPEYPCLKILQFDLQSQRCVTLVDPSSQHIISQQSSHTPTKIWHISSQLCLFLFWCMEDGDYVVRYVSYSGIGFDVELRVKNYSSENLVTAVSVALEDNCLHLLRAYGRYTKITVHKLEGLALKNQTIYAI